MAAFGCSYFSMTRSFHYFLLFNYMAYTSVKQTVMLESSSNNFPKSSLMFFEEKR
ncbi:protein of unknown function [Bartonella clarridgeiae 73]|uniref:Uncharacterized protein n=1 Tax=Bartonella clarridgeiae (strain CCUG 45776 / CIP 104772 / 73) TaxID=696125 RepID=E6YIT2_BARC7|nr:protein of unknown function [Bartonella clarridgeiae 73]